MFLHTPLYGICKEKHTVLHSLHRRTHTHICATWIFPGGFSGKEPTCQCRRCRFDPWVRKIPWRREWLPTPVFLPGEFHGQRTLVSCSPWCHKESDTTERLHIHFSPSGIGEGNGNPLQCSCLENSRDGGALWAAVYGVAQSRT